MKNRPMVINPIRHMEAFSPKAFNREGLRVDVIGCGATGSRIAISLAKLGITDLHVWDFDKIEGHNLANQGFVGGEADIGRFKTEAIRDLILQATGTEINIHTERVDGSQELGNVVFLLTDTMASRKLIWSEAIRLKIAVKLMIETRMGVESGKVYTINPARLSHIEGWEATLSDDKSATASACGAVSSIGSTAEIISGLAVWQLMYWFQQQQGKDVDFYNEMLLFLRPPTVMTRNFF